MYAKTVKISIHTTRVGGDVIIVYSCPVSALFQSTPPVWVVTHSATRLQDSFQISIHTTRVGGDPTGTDRYGYSVDISIHTTRVGGDRNF